MKQVANTKELTPSEIALIKLYKVKRARKIILWWIYIFAAIILILWGINPYMQFAINGTTSIDGLFFFVNKTEKPTRGHVAAFYPPKGNLYPDEMWFGKYIAGLPGDEVSIVGRDFYINNHFIGKAKEFTSGGIPLEMSKPGVIPAGYYFMWTGHEDSYDSRYADIGWIPEESIFGRVYRIF